MARLTPSELKKHRLWLMSWHNPSETIAYVDEVIDRMGSVDFFSQPGCTFLRDAWAAGLFGQARDATAVRLVADQWPDIELRVGDAIERFEVVEADLEGRRRADEYEALAEEIENEGFSSVEDDPIEDWIARADEAPAAIARVIRAKLAKHYVKGASLLVMLNIDEYGIRQKEIEAEFPAAVAIGVHAFKEVWILWKKRAYGPWSHLPEGPT